MPNGNASLVSKENTVVTEQFRSCVVGSFKNVELSFTSSLSFRSQRLLLQFRLYNLIDGGQMITAFWYLFQVLFSVVTAEHV